MLENSFGITFFLKSSTKGTKERYVYLRITVDGIPKETSTKRKWEVDRWSQRTERATGSREDAKVLNFFLDALYMKIQQFKSELMLTGHPITTQKIMDFVMGKNVSKAKVVQEFQKHNDELLALVEKGEYAIGTHVRFEIAKKHVKDYLRYKYNVEDMDFHELNFEFIKDYEFYLKTVKNISHNTAVKYITNFKKIVLLAIDKEIITADPFKRFKAKKIKVPKKPLSAYELAQLENHTFSTPRLATVRDVFVFQCYTGLAYIDAFNLKKSDIKFGIDGEMWIITERQKTGSSINIPLLPKAKAIMERYKEHKLCLERNSVLPVTSNQKMNAYLKEIADLCGIESTLNTHKARRTFGSTVTLNNDVPIHVVKELLGHQSVKQTEEYAITEQQSVGREMKQLQMRLSSKETTPEPPSPDIISKMQQEIQELKELLALSHGTTHLKKV
ncbi:site-specific integrase [Flavobacterium coralii]|uniref:site-specific integrase n=1 Tax=Flavobacterium coralii TaxID=2838017 RepID=UPI000C6ADBE1|nr:recombinase [Flavobacterium sp.]|tara:strand:- start:6632 stop:7966 length:1335 start_codon:yes stop_codon:yes gene_type:complete